MVCLFYTFVFQFRGKQPVMVFFHQGGFLTGSGNSNIAGPQYLLDKDVVFVTVNYRLGAFGNVSLCSKLLTIVIQLSAYN